MKKRKNIRKHFIRTISVLMAMTTLWVASALPASAEKALFTKEVADSLGNAMYVSFGVEYTIDTSTKQSTAQVQAEDCKHPTKYLLINRCT